MKDGLEKIYIDGLKGNKAIGLMSSRLGNIELPKYHHSTVDGVKDMNVRLSAVGGFPQQIRMIRDKRHSLDQATKYSYQGALVKKYYPDNVELLDGERDTPPVRALINSDKLKQDYDDKIISIGFEYDFKCGDIFEWCNTNSYWLIYLQDLAELAYFRGNIRRCKYTIDWIDEDGNKQRTYAAIRGPIETKINYIQKHGISVDTPNYSLNILLPKSEEAVKYFTRYSKFYLSNLGEPYKNTCWRVEAIDFIGADGIIEVNAVEYYSNSFEDDVENGLIGALKVDSVEETEQQETKIFGETFIRPKKEYCYYVKGHTAGTWHTSNNVPVKIEQFIDENKNNSIKLKWTNSYSGQFDLWIEDANITNQNIYKKTIVVESLF